MSLHVVTGPMFAGKTTALIRAVEGRDVLVVKPSLDDRYDADAVVTHDGVSLDCTVVPADDVSAIRERLAAKQQSWIAFDEAQFFDTELIGLVSRLRDEYGVVVAGLEKDFRNKGFGPMPGLIEMADSVERLTSTCAVCGGEARCTQRLVAGEPASVEGEQVVVGADGTYEPRCRDCHETG